MDKGGTQTGEQICALPGGLKIQYHSRIFICTFWSPAETEDQVNKQIDEDIAFIKKNKTGKPATEIIIYIYSPVPTEGSEMYDRVLASGFKFPEKLEDWISPAWKFWFTKKPLTPRPNHIW